MLEPKPKMLDAWSQSLNFEYWLHRPEKSTEWQNVKALHKAANEFGEKQQI